MMLPEAPHEDEFDALDRVVRAGISTYLQVGRALLRIRDAKLYRPRFATFADYCRDVAGGSRAWAYKVMAASTMHDAILSTGVDIPTQAAALALAKFPVEHQPTIARAAAAAAAALNQPLTSGTITRTGEAVMQAVTLGTADVEGSSYPLTAALLEQEVEAVKRGAELMRTRQGLTRVDDDAICCTRVGDEVTLRFKVQAPENVTFVVFIKDQSKNQTSKEEAS